MEIFKTILPPVAIGIAAILLLLLIFKIRKHMRISAALSAPRGRHYIQGLLSAAFSEDTVKYSVRLPQKLYAAPSGALTIDCMLITRGGITIIDILPVKGALDNPYTGSWGQKTPEGVLPIANPFEIGNGHVEALRKLLAAHGIFNAAVNVIVLLPSEKVVLHYNNDKILTSEKLIPYIHDFDRNRFLGSSEQKQVAALIDRFTAKAALRRKNSRGEQQ